eukprot:TRINITY_DN8693_c0_g1_i3.p1 TRINITY_DN8693_c0_g1~~TRINITY_DN8693_c0_g1_i3.p1  ORF type:complete len:289 (-),score=4.15 TRINITY_DN8693_c0_g1_i3:571-1437(-)
MSTRTLAWRNKPSQQDEQAIEQALSSQLYLLNRIGPTSFLIKQNNDSDRKYRVDIGSTITCSCQNSKFKEHDPHPLCHHTFFVMIKILKIPKTNPLVWQRALLDRELDEILHFKITENKPANVGNKAVQDSKTRRKQVEDDEVCAICFNTMDKNKLSELVFCENGCGNNVHGQCMKVWRDHQKSNTRTLTCPICRKEWGEFRWNPIRTKARRHLKNEKTKCSHCNQVIDKNKELICRNCQNYFLCRVCFGQGIHVQHPFIAFNDNDQTFQPVQHPAIAPLCVQLRPRN